MALARISKICLDAVAPGLVGRFWAALLGAEWRAAESGEGGVYAPGSEQPWLWINRVSEPKTVKHRVHLDVYARTLADVEALGALVAVPEGDDRRWTVLLDPEGGEFCAFLRDPVPEPRLHGFVVDCTDAFATAGFWQTLLGGRLEDNGSRWGTVDGVAPYTLDFVPVPEPKIVKNRVHLDLAAPAVEPILSAGARVLREPDGNDEWYVLADPEGNEFCLFLRPERT